MARTKIYRGARIELIATNDESRCAASYVVSYPAGLEYERWRCVYVKDHPGPHCTDSMFWGNPDGNPPKEAA